MSEERMSDIPDRMSDIIFTEEEFFCEERKPVDRREVFDIIRDIKDPDFPRIKTLEQCEVVRLDLITVNDERKRCYVEFTPEYYFCHKAALIGVCIKVQLERMLPFRFKVDVKIAAGYHHLCDRINKQLNDKEMIAEALEAEHLLAVINDCLMLPEPQPLPNFVQLEILAVRYQDLRQVEYIQRSRQPINTYRRWIEVLDSLD